MTTDAVEILRRHFGYGFRRKLSLFLARIKLRKEKRDYSEGFDDGYALGLKSRERHPWQ